MSDLTTIIVDTVTAKASGAADGLPRGVAVGVTPGATETVVSFMLAADRVILGFLANATGDGRYKLRIGATIIADGEVHNIQRNIERIAPAGRLAPAGSTITLEVTSESPDASDFYGTVILV